MSAGASIGASSTDGTAPPQRHGRLILVPNAMDFGGTPQDLSNVLPQSVLQWAARLQHWLVEDARSARAFLKRVNDRVPLQHPLQELSIVELPRAQKGGARVGAAARPTTEAASRVMQALLLPALEGHDVGLLSEAGMPAIADPGAAVVASAHALGLAVLPLPGSSSLLLALAASGLDGQSFAFVGYLPQEAAARRDRIRELEGISRRLQQTQVFIETPYRNSALLAALVEHAAPGTRLSVSVGLTLPEGWSRTATIGAWRKLAASSAGARARAGARVGAEQSAPDGGASQLTNRLPAVFLLQA